MMTRPVYIAGGSRTPFVKSMTDYSDVDTQTLMTAALQSLVSKMHLEGKIIGDVALGALMNSPSNWNLARECVLGSALHPYTPAYNVQRACGTSLETTLQIALKIANRQMDEGIAGGVDTNSDISICLNPKFSHKLLKMKNEKSFFGKMLSALKIRPSDLKFDYPSVTEPRTHLSMGQHCEKMVKEWNVSRKEQDELALKSHQNGVAAYANGFYDDLVFEFEGVKRDKILRENTSLEQLAKLSPAFDRSEKGTLTAGNSSPLTDGAGAVFLVCEEAAKKFNVPMLARFVDAQAAAVDFVHGEGLLMAPTIAVSKLLERNHLTLQDFDFYEIHEAFAGQVICALKAW